MRPSSTAVPRLLRFHSEIPLAFIATVILGFPSIFAQTPVPTPVPKAIEVDPLVKASAYGDKTVWSYHGKDPLPWAIFKPRDYGSSKITFNAEGVRSVGEVPSPGVHPRIFFSPEDLPGIRKRLKEDPAAQAAWKNILAWSHALKKTYDPTADYAQPDWANGAFGIHGRIVDLHRIGGYDPKREDYFAKLAAGESPAIYEKNAPAGFFPPAAAEAFRCLIEEDAEAAKTLAKATVTAVKLEQQRRAAQDKPVLPGQPPKPSTSRSAACSLGYIYDFIFNWMTPEQQKIVHDELVTLSSWQDNYGSFNNAEASRSNWATFSYWVFDLMAIEGEPGFNDLKFLALYRGWRNFFTYSFFDSGAAYEAEGKLLFGLDAAVAFDRVGKKYGLEPLTQHPLPRAYYSKFSSLAMLPTRNSFAVFDILGGMGGGFTTPQDLVIAHYLFPQDKTIDFVYRALVGDDYRTMPSSLHSHWNQAVQSAIFATAYSPEVDPEKLNLPLTFFCGQRALMMTRSSWDRNATMLTMQVRGASGGHPYRDRNGIMLAGQGRTWVTIPSKDIGGWACDTVIIDNADQTASTPARVVDFVDQPDATFLTGDSKYSWDWVWSTASRNKKGQPCTFDDVVKDNVDTGSAWQLVSQSFNDFAWTKSDREIYQRPLKMRADWIAIDGIASPMIRQVNSPVLKSFRTAGLIRGSRPYVLVVDDVQRDAMPAQYDWNLSLPADVVSVVSKPGSAPGIILAGKDSLDEQGQVKPGEPALLVRVVGYSGQVLPTDIGLREKWNVLSLHVRSASPDFKVLLYAFRMGDPIPATSWDAQHTTLTVDFPDQKDAITFSRSASGKSDLVVNRGGKAIAAVNRPVAPLGDPESDALTQRISQIPIRVAALRQQGFNPRKHPSWIAGWTFDKVSDGAYAPATGSVPTARPIPAGTSQIIKGLNGQPAVAVGKDGLVAPMDFAAQMGGPFTATFWVKTKTNPSMGNMVDFNAHSGFSLDIVQGGMRFNTLRGWGQGGGSPSSMLSSWTQFAVVFDGQKTDLYRNGLILMSIPAEGRKVGFGKEFKLGVGDLECSFGDINFYQAALTPEEVESLYLWSKFGAVAAR